MTIEAIKTAIVRAVSDSNFQIDFINNNDDGSLAIKVSKPTKYNNFRSIQGIIKEENDITMFCEALTGT